MFSAFYVPALCGLECAHDPEHLARRPADKLAAEHGTSMILECGNASFFAAYFVALVSMRAFFFIGPTSKPTMPGHRLEVVLTLKHHADRTCGRKQHGQHACAHGLAGLRGDVQQLIAARDGLVLGGPQAADRLRHICTCRSPFHLQ